jgi:hypothetical protein
MFPAVAAAAVTPLVTTPAQACSPTAALPCNTSPPTILPASEVTAPPEGRILNVTPGTWTGTPTPTYTYRWEHCESTPATPIAGAINTTYTIASTDVGHTLCVLVTAKNSAGSASVTSAATGVVQPGSPLDRSAPTISGPAQDGQTLTAGPGDWAGTMPITYGYQWRRCTSGYLGCVSIPGATSITYVVQDADLGHTLVVLVTATNSAGSSVPSVNSRPTAAVTPSNTAVPTLSGTAQQGKTLTESHGSWIPSSPTGFAYQWEDCDTSGAACSAIAGATSQTYALTASDIGHTVRVQESVAQAGVTSSPASSAVTGVVQPAPPTPSGSRPGNSGQPTSNGSIRPPKAADSTEIRTLLVKALAHGKGARIGALLKQGGYSFSFRAPSPGRLVISWYHGSKHGAKILVATATVAFHKAGIARIRLILTGKGRRLFSGASNVKLTAKGGFTPVAQATISATRSLALKP